MPFFLFRKSVFRCYFPIDVTNTLLWNREISLLTRFCGFLRILSLMTVGAFMSNFNHELANLFCFHLQTRHLWFSVKFLRPQTMLFISGKQKSWSLSRRCYDRVFFLSSAPHCCQRLDFLSKYYSINGFFNQYCCPLPRLK